MTPSYTHRMEPRIIIMRFHPASDGSRCRDSQPNIRQSSGNPEEENEEELEESRGSRPHNKNSRQNQLTRGHRGSQKLN